MPVIDARVPRARKVHVADCGHTIHPGSLYIRLYGSAEDGDPVGSLKLCLGCVDQVHISKMNIKFCQAINNHPDLVYDVTGSLNMWVMVNIREVRCSA